MTWRRSRPTTSVRPSCATPPPTGYRPACEFDIVLNNLVAWAFTTGHVHLKSDGTPWRPIVHIEDIARAFIAVLAAPRELVHGEALNVGSTAENYQIRRLATIVAEVVPGSAVDFAPGASPDTRDYRVDCGKIGRVLGFETRWTARQGAEELLAAYRATGLTLDEFEGPKYLRLAEITRLRREGSLDDQLRFTARPRRRG